MTRLIGGPPSRTRENNVNAHWRPSASTTAWGEDTSHQEDEPMNSGETGERGGGESIFGSHNYILLASVEI